MNNEINNNNEINYEEKSKSELFQFVQLDERIFDKKMETKAIGYFQDVLIRFGKNKSSVIAFFFLIIVILFAIFAPMLSPYNAMEADLDARLYPPKIPFLEKLGIANGTRKYKANVDFIISITDPRLESFTPLETENYYFIEYITNFDSFDEIEAAKYKESFKNIDYYYVNIRYDIYAKSAAPTWVRGATHADYLEYKANDQIYTREDGEEVVIVNKKGASAFETGLLELPEGKTLEDYYTYKIFTKGGNVEPAHYFGTDLSGRDVWTRLWLGTRTSLLIGLFVALVTITFGVFWGSISGYYGGRIDLIMERFTEVLGGIPWIVIIVIMKLYLRGVIPSTLIVALSLVLTSWIGTASMVRAQMYRYKNREYVLASKTFGASDGRLIFKHILPNALGTIVTGTILVIPGAIFFESSVAYLGLGIDSSTISIGNLLNLGREIGIVQYPYLTLFPALLISVLMISFNMFGNGLRDALNPSLRGAE